MSKSVIDMKKVLQAPGLQSPEDLLRAIIRLEDFLIDFNYIEEAVGKYGISSGMLEQHIKNLKEVYKIVTERETWDLGLTS